MKCPKCKGPEMKEAITVNKWIDLIEMIYECPQCKTVFFGTLYKKEEGGDKKE